VRRLCFTFPLHLWGAMHSTEPATPRRAAPDRPECAAYLADGPETTPNARPPPTREAPDCSGRTEPSVSEGGKLFGRERPAKLSLSVTTTAGNFLRIRDLYCIYNARYLPQNKLIVSAYISIMRNLRNEADYT
jgi:hypothetical protein